MKQFFSTHKIVVCYTIPGEEKLDSLTGVWAYKIEHKVDREKKIYVLDLIVFNSENGQMLVCIVHDAITFDLRLLIKTPLGVVIKRGKFDSRVLSCMEE